VVAEAGEEREFNTVLSDHTVEPEVRLRRNSPRAGGSRRRYCYR
jgi:hypothetical protein